MVAECETTARNWNPCRRRDYERKRTCLGTAPNTWLSENIAWNKRFIRWYVFINPLPVLSSIETGIGEETENSFRLRDYCGLFIWSNFGSSSWFPLILIHWSFPYPIARMFVNSRLFSCAFQQFMRCCFGDLSKIEKHNYWCLYGCRSNTWVETFGNGNWSQLTCRPACHHGPFSLPILFHGWVSLLVADILLISGHICVNYWHERPKETVTRQSLWIVWVIIRPVWYWRAMWWNVSVPIGLPLSWQRPVQRNRELIIDCAA